MGSAEQAAPLILVLFIAAIASISLNVGKAVQKMKVEVLRQKKAVLTPPYRRDFLIWCVGMLMTLVAGILLMVAQKMTDKTSLVSALNGVGLIGLALFAWLVLKEKVGGREWGSVLVIIIGTVIVSYFNVAVTGEKTYNFVSVLWVSGVSIVALTLMLFASLKLGRGHAFVFAAMAGVCLGLMNILYHIGPIAGGGTLAGSFKTAYPYAGFMVGNCAFVFTNLAFFHGRGITVVPTVNSFMIVSPMLFEFFIFGVSMRPIQYVGAVFIVFGVIALTTGAIAEKPKTPAQATA
jgi:drug/metabolite transporter (DMT)-like permease